MYKYRGDAKTTPPSIHDVYSRSLKSHPKGKEEETKNITYPYLEPNQLIKLTRQLGYISTDTLDQDHNLYIKEYFGLWIYNSFSNANKFFSFHTDKKMHKGATYQAFL